jgi:lysosomal acid lipase/cholesteryl ester hydrolase
MNSPDKAPAFLLAKNGFDVWLSNSRGNKFSKKHLSLNPN